MTHYYNIDIRLNKKYYFFKIYSIHIMEASLRTNRSNDETIKIIPRLLNTSTCPVCCSDGSSALAAADANFWPVFLAVSASARPARKPFPLLSRLFPSKKIR